jgi:hypothetical protein
VSEFTKEELQMLLGAVSLWMEEIAFSEEKGDPYDSLYCKIKSTIDNYCDHEFIFNLNDSAVHCHKCKKVLNE